jgi:Gnt-I system high-affinity gluconate transporter
MPILITFIGILILLILIIQFKVNTFLSLVMVTIGIGLAQGMGIETILKSMQSGVGSTLGELIFILGFGAMLGGLIAESGAAQQITDNLMKMFGKKNIHWALVFSGFIIGIPMFYTVAFVMIVPLIFAIASTTRLPILYLAVPMTSALSVTHGFLPPHPAPTAIAIIYKADIGLTLLYGLMIAIPVMIIAGPLFGRIFRNFHTQIPQGVQEYKSIPENERPSLLSSLYTALLPVLLIAVAAISQNTLTKESMLNQSLQFIGQPIIALLIALVVGILVLGVAKGKKMDDLGKIFSNATKDIAMILLIIGAGGALKQVLVDSGISNYIVASFEGSDISPLVLAWGVAAALRISLGSATVAALTAAGIVSPLISQGLVSPELLVLATGAGSLTCSQVNDTGFWLFKEYFNLTIWETFKSWTLMETIVSVLGLTGCLVLDIFV